MQTREKPKFGPTRGEYVFRLCAGAVILALGTFAVASKGLPVGLTSTESILFGMLFGLFLVGHSGWKLAIGHHR